MASPPLTVALPPNLIVGGGYVIELAATNPSTDGYVSGVTVQNVTLQVEVLSGGGIEPAGSVLLIPAGGK